MMQQDNQPLQGSTKTITVAELLKDFPIETLFKPKSGAPSQDEQLAETRQTIDDAKAQEEQLTQDAKAQAKAALLGL